MPYSSDVYVLFVDTRQYLTILSPSNNAVLMFVLPMSMVKIMGFFPSKPRACMGY